MINTGQGYNNPLYNNPYNNYMGNSNYYNQSNGIMNQGYYNPYLAQRMRQQQEEQMRLIQEQNMNTYNELRRMSLKFHGIYDEEKFNEQLELEKQAMYPSYEQANMMNKQNMLHQLSQIDNAIKSGEYVPPLSPINQHIVKTNTIIRGNYEKFGIDANNPDVNLPELLDKMGDLRVEEVLHNTKMQSRNMNKYYDSNSYRNLINLHSSDKDTQYFNSFNTMNLNTNNHNIDPMEVTLPNMPSEYRKRRDKFIQSMLGNVNMTSGGGI